MKIHNAGTHIEVGFASAEEMYFSPDCLTLLDDLNNILSGHSSGANNILCSKNGTGKTALMRNFCLELRMQGKNVEVISADRLVSELFLAMRNSTGKAFLHKKRELLVLDDCFTIHPQSSEVWIFEAIRRFNPQITMFFLFDCSIDLALSAFAPTLHIDKIYTLSHPNADARKAFAIEYVRRQKLNVSTETVTALAQSILQIAPLRAALQRQHLQAALSNTPKEIP